MVRRYGKILSVLGIVLFILFIYLSDLQDVIDLLRNSNVFYIFCGLGCCFVSFFFRSNKLNILLNTKSSEKIGVLSFIPYNSTCNLLSYLTPARSGDILSPFVFRNLYSISYGKGISMVLLDRVTELLVLAIGLIGCLAYFLTMNLWKITQLHLFIGSITTISIIVIIASLFLLFRKKEIFFRLTKKSNIRFIQKSSSYLIEKSIEIVNEIKNIKTSVLVYEIIPFTLLAWLFDVIALYFFYGAVIEISLIHIVFLQFVNVGVVIVSFIPAGIGIGEINSFYFLQVLGYSKIGVSTGILISRVVGLLFIIVFGVSSYCLITFGKGTNKSG